MTKKLYLPNSFMDLPDFFKNFVCHLHSGKIATYSSYVSMEDTIRNILKTEYGVISFRENDNGWYDSDDIEFATEEDYIRFVLIWS